MVVRLADVQPHNAAMPTLEEKAAFAERLRLLTNPTFL
ncbi:conserved hypothetical protein [Burkholderia mallei NCTC 10247]|nr:conserved hypothetical protein [Burkholderia mallei SAVP1]ABO02318.1 conserved hypothetical protein [Burkholderia mallei NCTC 10247]EEP83458.1 conserved hypothetical protein [Burkholderia mallei GB8 horse 4]